MPRVSWVSHWLVALSVLVLIGATGCPRVASQEEIERSRRELELAAALHDEQNIPGAIEHLREALELDDDNAEAHLLFAIIQHLHRNNTPVAAEHARKGVELLVAQERQGATLAEARNILGSILIEQRQYEEAATVLRASAIDDMNTSPHLAWGNLGLAYLRNDQPTEAVEPLLQAVRMQPRFCVGYHRLGQAYVALEDWQRADEALSAAVEVDETCANTPQLQNAWRLRAEVRAQQGDPQGAIADLERCVALGARTSDGEVCQRLLDGAARRAPAPPSDADSTEGPDQVMEGDA